MTNEEDLQSRAIKSGTLLTSTENSKIGTACKTTGETLKLRFPFYEKSECISIVKRTQQQQGPSISLSTKIVCPP